MSAAPPPEAGAPPPSPAPAAEPGPRRPRLSARKKLGFLLVTVALGTCLLEGALQLLGFPRGVMASTRELWALDDERALGPFRPGARVLIASDVDGGLDYTAEINALGLRGPLPAAGEPLVLCVGDSTTFGSFVEEEETYPFQLRAALQAAGVRATTLNAGAPRWTISDEAEFLQAALPRLRPRAVVILFCGNDLVELSKAPARARALRSRDAWSDLRTRLAIPEVTLLAGIKLRKRWLMARGKWPPEMRPDQLETGDWARPLWAGYARELEAAVALCRAQGARVLVAAFPAFGELELERCEVERTLPELVRAAGAEYVDLYPAFRAAPEDPFLRPLDPHANARGGALIAGEVARALARGWR